MQDRTPLYHASLLDFRLRRSDTSDNTQMQPNPITGATAPKLAPDFAEPDPIANPAEPLSQKVHFPGEDGGRSLNNMAQRDLEATLQLLAERAQYITGATGAAIALRSGEEIVCRASAGSVAPEIGAHLQMESGLSGESIRTKQILRCNDAQTDTRVNRESCEALGISSVVVMPLLRDNEVNGVFELLSNRPNAFEERDIGALERLGEMVQTALDHASAARAAAEPAKSTVLASALEKPAEITSSAVVSPDNVSLPDSQPVDAALVEIDPLEFDINESPAPTTVAAKNEISSDKPSEKHAPQPNVVESKLVEPKPNEIKPVEAKVEEQKPATIEPSLAEIDEAATQSTSAADAPKIAVASQIRKCSACGFPVSEGRTLCLDCEKKEKPASTLTTAQVVSDEDDSSTPLFTMGAAGDAPESWFARNKILMVVAVVVVVLVTVLFLFR